MQLVTLTEHRQGATGCHSDQSNKPDTHDGMQQTQSMHTDKQTDKLAGRPLSQPASSAGLEENDRPVLARSLLMLLPRGPISRPTISCGMLAMPKLLPSRACFCKARRGLSGSHQQSRFDCPLRDATHKWAGVQAPQLLQVNQVHAQQTADAASWNTIMQACMHTSLQRSKAGIRGCQRV